MTDLVIRRLRDVGAIVRAARQARGLTQAELADSLGFSRDYLRSLEQGRGTLHELRLLRTLANLGIDLTAHYELGDADGDQR
ncbi:MAG: helix-turn-helix domain-containing protein [Bifidobacteriaceae bacterium]|jgi:transcriptional regulator with XRE-family HTH domain|nr:helix-turn-helix domain-containing protein [Bifidobacteriaceae bacterium]